MSDRLAGSRVLVTCADIYMGPLIVDLFAAEGADVVADTDPLTKPDAPQSLIEQSGNVDAVIANLDLAAASPPTVEIDDETWLEGFEAMVHPLMRLVRAVAPQMIERGGGSIVAITSS